MILTLASFVYSKTKNSGKKMGSFMKAFGEWNKAGIELLGSKKKVMALLPGELGS